MIPDANYRIKMNCLYTFPASLVFNIKRKSCPETSKYQRFPSAYFKMALYSQIIRFTYKFIFVDLCDLMLKCIAIS